MSAAHWWYWVRHARTILNPDVVIFSIAPMKPHVRTQETKIIDMCAVLARTPNNALRTHGLIT